MIGAPGLVVVVVDDVGRVVVVVALVVLVVGRVVVVVRRVVVVVDAVGSSSGTCPPLRMPYGSAAPDAGRPALGNGAHDGQSIRFCPVAST